MNEPPHRKRLATERADTTRLPTLLLLVLTVLVLPLNSPHATAQSPEEIRDYLENLKRKSDAKIPYNRIVMSYRNTYRDLAPDIRKLRQLREMKGNRTEVDRLKTRIRSRVNSRLKKTGRTIAETPVSDAADPEAMKRLKEINRYFNRYVEKLLSNWQPTERQRKMIDAYPVSRLVRKGLAGPDVLRRMFLDKLMGYIVKYYGYLVGTTFPSRREAAKYRRRVDDLYNRIFPRFMQLLSRVDRVRKQERKAEKRDEDESESSEDSNAEDETKTEQKMDEAVRRTVKEVNREWTKFLKRFSEERRNVLNGLNRVLVLYRDRGTLPREQAQVFQNSIRAKRRFQKLLTFDRETNIFKEGSRIREILATVGEYYVRKVDRLRSALGALNDARTVLTQAPEVREKGKTNLERQKEEIMSGDFRKRTIRRLKVPQAKQALTDLEKDVVTSVRKRLIESYGPREKRLGKLVRSAQQIAKKAGPWARKVVSFTDWAVSTYKELRKSTDEKFQTKYKRKISRAKKAFDKTFEKLSERFETFSRKKERYFREMENR